MISQQVNDRPFKYKHYKHLWFLVIAIAYLVAFFVLERFIPNDYPHDKMFLSHIPLDDKIPFLPWMIIFYFAWYPGLLAVGAYLMVRDVGGFKRYMTYVGVTFFTMIIVCALFPNYQDMRPDITGNENVFTRILKGIYTADTYTNVLPSGHVFGSFAIAIGVFENKNLRKHIWLDVITIIVAVLISVSTVFVKQHSILDGIASIPLSIMWYFVVYKLIFREKKEKTA
ncbi:MAG: phosphatase PAP2 family protein [Clostridia bacterium]|nr:phosphatase PAP2 family protein [Clostridia bacterium]